MSSLIAIKVKTNMRLVSTKLSLFSPLSYVPLFKLNWYNNNYNYNNNCLFDTTIRYSDHNHFVSNTLIR